MLSNQEIERYGRHIIIDGFGVESQEKLKQANVLVVGAGGLGCPVLLYLTAAGCGKIGIADDDKVSLSNLQRQVLYTSDDVGRYKVETAKQKLVTINPHVDIETYNTKIHPGNALDIIKDYDIVVDGTDNFSSRYLLNDACVMLNKPLVYGAIHKFEGQVSVFNLDGGPTYRCLFPEPPPQHEMPSCSEIGVIGALPGIIGTWQAVETIKLITGVGEPLKGKLMTMDLLTNQTRCFNFNTIPGNKKITRLEPIGDTCENIPEITFDTLQEWTASRNIQLIDVREKYEFEHFNIKGENLPLSGIENCLDQIDANMATVVLCQSGVRSKKAITLIRKKHPDIDIYNLQGGIARAIASPAVQVTRKP